MIQGLVFLLRNKNYFSINSNKWERIFSLGQRAVAAVLVSRVLSSVLFGVSPVDLIGLGTAVLLVLGVALAAGVLAARPASRSNPMATLRDE